MNDLEALRLSIEAEYNLFNTKAVDWNILPDVMKIPCIEIAEPVKPRMEVERVDCGSHYKLVLWEVCCG